MTLWPDQAKYRLADQAGLSLEAAQWLVEGQKAMLLGADNFGVESFPLQGPGELCSCHSYLLAERGVSLLEAFGWKTWRRIRCTSSCSSPRL